MAGIYIHIPFCKQACHYCDFHFSTSLKNKDAFLISLKKEIELQKNYLEASKISTIYFGGGTPSLLSESELMHIFDTLNSHFEIAPDAEITLEANPDDLSLKKIKELKHTPVNRLSVGIQSFFDEDLVLMNRAHTSKEALSVVQTSQDAGFENITIDLIYGIQTLTNEKWKHNLQTAFDLQVKHISSYCLTVEAKTALSNFIKTGKVKNVDEQQSIEQFEIMVEKMKENDFIHYEISNFCKKDYHSKHNSNYWLKENYLGLGPSAHSYNGISRQWNISNNALYIQSLENNKLNFEEETLTAAQKYNEYILTSLRTIWGTDLNCIKTIFGTDYLTYCIKESEKYISEGKLLNQENKLFLTEKGKLLADKIASDLFYISD
ncbi:MAG: coproporphyrinogen III oxidase [Bacteroidetes bacterium RIFCSPLOWO2_12_FULL_35_15]|nr:MAG: coproporphyrinogen III oxidase [Bacteroidetes bacterium RIFCSPLOWO2_12_FULL_35_15]